jgi:hypothetical protein
MNFLLSLRRKLVPPIADRSRGPEAYQRPLLRSILAGRHLYATWTLSRRLIRPPRVYRTNTVITSGALCTSVFTIFHFVSVPDRPMRDSSFPCSREDILHCVARSWGVKIEHPSIHRVSLFAMGKISQELRPQYLYSTWT